MAIHPCSPVVGAEIRDIDLSRPTADDLATIRSALLAHHVVFFRDQRLDDQRQRDLAAHFGPLQRFPFGAPVDDALPEVHAIATGGVGPRVGNADIWHSDATFMKAPPYGSILRAVELPPCGGDTLFANMGAAYDALSSSMQRLIDDLTATHDFTHSSAHRRPLDDRYPPVSHPVVRVLPESGRKALYVNRIFTVRIDQLSARENDVVLPFLCDHVRSPDFQCRFSWTPGAVAFWDNRCTQHYAVPDYSGERRVMHRVTVTGERPS
jgi:taurine dioxygenase